jgi:hypothetical protein
MTNKALNLTLPLKFSTYADKITEDQLRISLSSMLVAELKGN